MENTPLLKLMAGTILLHAQKPPRGSPETSRAYDRAPSPAREHLRRRAMLQRGNELGPLVEGLLKHYDEYIHEIILVDDNSKDRSRQIMHELVEYEPRVRPVFREHPMALAARFQRA